MFAYCRHSFGMGTVRSYPCIRIDDLGAFHSVNEACIETYQSGIARSVEVMPVAAWYPEAVRLLKENPGLDAGLHLVITVNGKM